MTAVVVDCGNSRMKWGFVQNGRVTAMATLDYDRQETWLPFFESWGRPQSWSIASVTPKRSDEFVAWLTTRSISPRILTRADLFDALQNAGVTSLVTNRDRVGIDRLAGVLGGWRRREATTPVVTVALGTATTVDVTDADGVHQGGLILPGPLTMAKSLTQSTAELPWVEFHSSDDGETVGKDTFAAIRLAIRHATIGMIERAIATLTLPPTVFVCGGYADLLSNTTWLQQPVATMEAVPTLILEGLAAVPSC